MKEEVVFDLGSFETNAGILGLIRMLEFDKEHSAGKYHYKGEESLTVDKEYLMSTDLTELFMKTLISLEENTGKYPKLLSELKRFYDILLERDLEKEERKKLGECLDSLCANSYKGAYVVLKEKYSYQDDLYELIKSLKNEKDREKQLELLKTILEILNDTEIYDTLFFRELVYSRINKFWDGVSFLNRNNAKKEMKLIHYETFEKGFKEYLNSSSKKVAICEECGEPIGTTEKIDYGFLKGTTADTSRKRNDFWNYKVNSWVCPKCAFLFSLMPLGFQKNRTHYLFVNVNHNVGDMVKANLEKIVDENKDAVELYHEALLDFVQQETKVLDNIEVIEAGVYEKRYRVNVIQKEALEIIKKSEENLKKLLGCYDIKVDNGYLNLYNEVIGNIVGFRDNYSLIYLILKQGLADGKSIYPAWLILKIQYQISLKRKGSDLEMKNDLDTAQWLGEQLRLAIFKAKQTNDPKVLNSLCYKLLNAIHINDLDTFVNMVLRACKSYEATVPVLFMQALKNHENFNDLAHAYLMGLMYDKKYDKKETMENVEKGVDNI